VEQTSGAELPELKERVKGEVGEYRERLIDFIVAQGIELEFKESIAPRFGDELRRQNCHSSRTVRSGRVRHVGS
jgi:hypothetical protein